MVDTLTMHWLILLALWTVAGWWAWRVGEKQIKRLKQKVVLNRILGK